MNLLARIAALLLLLPAVNAAAAETADAGWNAVVALDAGPSQPTQTREEARTVALAFLARQEEALRRFLTRHPRDSRAVDAQLRLAHLLTTRSDLSENPKLYLSAVQLLDAALKTAPENRKADIAFAKVVLSMRRMPMPTDADRDLLTNQMYAFQKAFPNDPRVAPLLAEVAGLYDSQPKRKESLLNEAMRSARSEELRARIADDLKRLHLLGQPVSVHGETAEGAKVDIAGERGKVVLVYFFAAWSPPSLAGLEEIAFLRRSFPAKEVAIVGVNLDPTRDALSAALKPVPIAWPVIWESRGWESPLIRALAINALPTLWIVDKQGRLRTLNAKTESAALVRRLLKE